MERDNNLNNSLADRVIARQEEDYRISQEEKQLKFNFFSYELPERDNLGMPTANSIDYVVARILYIDNNISGREKLHLRDDGRIWEGDHWVSEDDRNLYRLTKWEFKPFTVDQKYRIWERLRECLPVLSYDKLVVKDNLVWDWKNNDLYFSEEDPITIN